MDAGGLTRGAGGRAWSRGAGGRAWSRGAGGLAGWGLCCVGEIGAGGRGSESQGSESNQLIPNRSDFWWDKCTCKFWNVCAYLCEYNQKSITKIIKLYNKIIYKKGDKTS